MVAIFPMSGSSWSKQAPSGSQQMGAFGDQGLTAPGGNAVASWPCPVLRRECLTHPAGLGLQEELGSGAPLPSVLYTLGPPDFPPPPGQFGWMLLCLPLEGPQDSASHSSSMGLLKESPFSFLRRPGPGEVADLRRQGPKQKASSPDSGAHSVGGEQPWSSK